MLYAPEPGEEGQGEQALQVAPASPIRQREEQEEAMALCDAMYLPLRPVKALLVYQ